MRYQLIAVFTLIAAQASAADVKFSPKRCYSTTTETPIAAAPGEGGLAVLPKGSTVKVKGTDGSGWVQVEYADSGVAGCPLPKGELKTGWLAEEHVGIYTAPLPHLIKEKRVNIAGQELNAFGEGLGSLLGERVTVVRRVKDDDVSGGRLKLHAEMPVNVYCLGKPPLSTVLVAASWEWAGDSESYNVKMKTKAKLPKGDCIVVNGAIAADAVPSVGTAAVTATTPNLCKTLGNRNLRKETDYFCVERRGPFTANGPDFAILKEGKKGLSGPSLTWWNLYDLTNPAKPNLLGKIGVAGGP